MRVTGYPRPLRRTGFTLIELLVVIAIIAVLMSLLAAGVMKAMGAGPRAKTRSEIGDFEIALVSARNEMGQVEYLPSRLVLREDGRYDKRSADHVTTMKILTKMFGKHVIGTFPNPPTGNPAVDNIVTAASAVRIGWRGKLNANGTPNIIAGDLVLDGPQCLCFYLGGIPSASGPLGFSKDPLNPAKAGGQRFGPYFNFVTNRLATDTNGFYYYLDPYLTAPYLYFSNDGTGVYNTSLTQTFVQGTQTINSGPDCPQTLGTFVFYNPQAAAGQLKTPILPFKKVAANGTYAQTTIFINDKSCQILSAGADLKFGDSTTWTPSLGYKGVPPGADDIANFSKSPLAGEQN
jgi:prepilin-type N-terminal cleavage/methylation domain-containing protein